MAKIDDADPRWIVSDRTDGRNVNSWHWEERDLSKSTHEALKEVFKGFSLLTSEDDSAMKLSIEEVSDVSGDVTVAQRKGKIMCYFELKLTLKWRGKVDGVSVDGKLIMPEIEHDNFSGSFEINVTCTDNNAASKKAEEWIRNNARAMVRAEVKKYFEELFKTHQVGTMVPSKQSSSAPSTAAAKPVSTPASAVKPTPVAVSSSSSNSFSWTMQWRVPIDELFSILMNDSRASIYTRAPAKINPQTNGAFEFLGGVITGVYSNVQAPTEISMQWRLSSWPSGVFSSVVMKLSKEEPAVTRLEFAQAGIPSGELDRVQQGWRVNFFDAIKMVFGFGMEYL